MSGWISQTGLALDEAFDVLAADQRNVLSKFLPEEFDEAAAMVRLFLAHAVEHLRRAGEILPQSFGEISIDALILFFQKNSQGQNLPLGKAFEVSHEELSLLVHVSAIGLSGKSRKISLN